MQPNCLTDLWDKITSCFRGSSSDDYAPVSSEEQELSSVVTVPQRRSESHLVGQGQFTTLTLNDSYVPGDLTACAMVFVLGSGKGCVYHWPFHTEGSSYLSKMQDAMSEAEIPAAAQCKVFGRDYDLVNPKRKEYLESWVSFGGYIQRNLGVAPEIFLCEDNYSNPILAYTSGGIVSRFPPFTSLETLTAA